MIEKIALRLLSLKSYSTYELKKKLLNKGFTAEEIAPLLEKYQRLGFLNDNDLTERRIEEFKKRGYGPHWIAGKLRTKGLNLGLKTSSYSLEEQKTVIQKLLKTPLFAKKDKPKQIAALQRRGFDLDVIFSTLDYY